MGHSELICDKETFSSLKQECSKIFDLQKRLPDFVFKRTFRRYCAIEYAQIYKKQFGGFLLKLSESYADEKVYYMTVDPDPVDYYYKRCSFFGLASFDPSNLAERYKSVMSRDGNIDSFFARGGDVGVFWGSSLMWGIFCDRLSWEIAVIAVSNELDISEFCGFRCIDATFLLEYIKSQYPKEPLVMDTAKTLLANYSIDQITEAGVSRGLSGK